MSALQDLEAHPNGTWENDIGRETVVTPNQNPGQSVVGKSKGDKDDQPNSRAPRPKTSKRCSNRLSSLTL